jgi:hypothetical protein
LSKVAGWQDFDGQSKINTMLSPATGEFLQDIADWLRLRAD